MKCGTQQQNSRWRTAAILKIVSDHNSAADCPILLRILLAHAEYRDDKGNATNPKF